MDLSRGQRPRPGDRHRRHGEVRIAYPAKDAKDVSQTLAEESVCRALRALLRRRDDGERLFAYSQAVPGTCMRTISTPVCASAQAPTSQPRTSGIPHRPPPRGDARCQ
ncbi:hypothetical protein [Streptomyces phaeochromogenes]